MDPIRLQYLKGSKEKNAWMLKMGAKDCRQWNVLTPLPGYTGVPTFGLQSLIDKGLLKGRSNDCSDPGTRH